MISWLAIGTLLAACSPQVGYSDYATQIFPEPLALTAIAAQNNTDLSALPETPTSWSGALADAYPVPATAGTPEAYPGETLLPSPNPTTAAALEQTGVAASTSTTAARETLTAEANSRPTVNSAPTKTPAPGITEVVINSKPDCMAGDQYTHCHDAVLAIDFDYPSTWGMISARYFMGGTAGHGYEYAFSVQTLRLQAGGRSRDYSEARGALLTDFYGFEEDPAGNPAICATYRANICRRLQTYVVFMLSLPQAEIVCQPTFYDYVNWLGLVAINVPKGPRISGFIFGSSVLSKKLSQELDVLLDVDPKAQQAKCQDAGARKQFDAKVKEIIDAIQASTIDPVTQANIDQLVHLAQSIRFD